MSKITKTISSIVIKIIKLALIFSLIASCNMKRRQRQAQQEQTKIRIVDLQGKYRPVETRYPELNRDALVDQGKYDILAFNPKSATIPKPKQEQQTKDNSGFAEASANNIQQALQPTLQTPIAEGSKTPQPFRAVFSSGDSQLVQTDQLVDAKGNEAKKEDFSVEKTISLSESAPKKDEPNAVESNQVKNLAENKTSESKGPEESKIVDSKNSTQVVEYDLSQPKNKEDNVEKPTKLPPKKEVEKIINGKKTREIVAKSAKTQAINSGLYVQVGSFSQIDNAQHALGKVKNFGKGVIESSNNGDKEIHRVLIGPFADKSKANAAISKLKANGQSAILVKK